MKIYFIYAAIPANVYDNTIKFLILNHYDFRFKHGKFYGLYAVTDKKKLLKEFMDFRKDSNIYTVVEANSNDIEAGIENYADCGLTLMRESFKNIKGEEVILVVTKNECTVSKYNDIEFMNEFGLKAIKGLHYELFSKKIIKALNKLGYPALFNRDNSKCILFGDFEPTPPYESIYSQLNILLYLFRYMFIGDETLQQVGDD